MIQYQFIYQPMYQLMHQINYQHINDSWVSLLGIFILTIITLNNKFKSNIVMYMMTIISAVVLNYLKRITIPYIFYCFFTISALEFMFNMFNYFKLMSLEIDKLSKVLETYGKDCLLFDIMNTKEKVDGEFLINYYKIIINNNEKNKNKDKAVIIDTINKLIIPENIKNCDSSEILDRINKFIKFVKKEKFQVQNSVYIYGFVPSNSIIRFYIKLVNQKKYIYKQNKNNYDNKTRAYAILRGLPNTFYPEDFLTYNFNEDIIPDYKVNSEEYFHLLINTITGIERYFDIYKSNNHYFF